MKVYYECAPCFLRQAREALDLATDDEELKIRVMENILELLSERFRRGQVSNELGTRMHRLIKDMTGSEDPYREEKRRCNEIAWRFLPAVREYLEAHSDLESHVRVAITGNIIDFGALGLDFDHDRGIHESLRAPLRINHVPILEERLRDASEVLYLLDNTGEILFDRPLIEKLAEYGVSVKVAVKGEPILNDACMEDALEAGLDEVAEIVTTGTDSVGIVYGDLSDEFRRMLDETELVIAKGMGNYEGLTEVSDGSRDIFCLLNAKCSAIARDLGVDVGDNVAVKI
ncbi:hypothetical protein DNK57_02535 [Methanothermobacter thermautotrophicus]|uniref:Damage-control phosphatase ARMT1-like metal-binding domain-containing protein n=1 Tax=Methanothermobacter thermautotrophicus TaxID=145262 RepID=A0A842YK27_METTF|nr:DUF89 domain-containing protein [Methanothermobacter thermautotrophicus]MBE2899706.1 hypothetical protein [Methanothermobacter thermautotrophicus]MCQ8905811.1 DUF89 domain-containing protein [Methanothermobacter sp.]